MPKVQGGLPIVWNDSMGAFAGLYPNPANAPTTSTYAGAAPNEIVLLAFSPGGGNPLRMGGAIQLNHNQFIGSTVAGSGSTAMTLKPHVHWTVSTSPTTNTYCEWKMAYLVAKPTATISSALGNVTRFGSTVATSSGRTTMPASTQSPDFAFRHYITALQDITVASSLCGPSMMIPFTLYASTGHNLGQSPMLLSFDIHYQCGPAGTDTEFS